MSREPEPHAALERALTRLVRRAFLPTAGERTRRQAGLDLERAAYGTLVQIADLGEPRLSDLAAALGLEVSTTSRHVQRLVADGYVEVATDPRDARARRYSPTPAGRDALERVRAARRAHLVRLLADWDNDDVTALADGLERILDVFEREERG